MKLFVCKNKPTAEKQARKSGQRVKNSLKGYISDETMDVLDELRNPALLENNSDVEDSENEIPRNEDLASLSTSFSC